MSPLIGVVRYEFAMGVRRWGVWLGMTLAALPIVPMLVTYGEDLSKFSIWSTAGASTLLLNALMPVVGGIAMADRLHRDDRLATSELLRVTRLPRSAYVLGKYFGAVGAVLAPALAVTLITAALLVGVGAPPALLAAQLVAFLLVNAPAYLFVGAFSLACPAVMPLRVFQVLFAGYWFWGNFPVPNLFPTLAGTPLTPDGVYAATGLFAVGGVLPWGMSTPAKMPWGMHTAEEAVVSIVLLLAVAGLALFSLERYLGLKEARA